MKHKKDIGPEKAGSSHVSKRQKVILYGEKKRRKSIEKEWRSISVMGRVTPGKKQHNWHTGYAKSCAWAHSRLSFSIYCFNKERKQERKARRQRQWDKVRWFPCTTWLYGSHDKTNINTLPWRLFILSTLLFYTYKRAGSVRRGPNYLSYSLITSTPNKYT